MPRFVTIKTFKKKIIHCRIKATHYSALMAWPLVEDFFCGFPYSTPIFFYCNFLPYTCYPLSFFVVNCKLYKLIIVFLIPGRAAARPAWRQAVPGQLRQSVGPSPPAKPLIQAVKCGVEIKRTRIYTFVDVYDTITKMSTGYCTASL